MVCYCNDGQACPEPRRIELLGLENEARVAADNWVMIAPYGDHPNQLGGKNVVQRVDRESANAMVTFFNSLVGKISRLFRGIPLFAGHPDSEDAGTAARYPDKRLHGLFEKLDARMDGLWGLLKPEATGKALVNSGTLLKLSPRWFAEEEPIGVENGVAIYRPIALASVGLTNRPNIIGAPTLPLLNESGKRETEGGREGEQQMKDLLKFVLGLVGLTNEAPAEGEELKPDLITKIRTGLQKLADQVKTIGQELQNEKTLHKQTSDQLTKVTGEKETAVTSFNNERTGRIAELLGDAVQGGRITAAEKAAWERRLKADFTNELPELRRLPAKVKMQGRTDGAGRRGAGLPSDGVQKVTELINEELAKLPAGTRSAWDKATQAAMRKHPEAFRPAEKAETE